jgi:hypothetical protein
VKTSREKILEVIDAHGWTVTYRDKPNLLATWRRLKVIVQFDEHDRVRGAAISKPLPYNAGMQQIPVEAPKLATVLAFIRGETSP